MYNAVEFERNDNWRESYATVGNGHVFIVPSQVVMVERFNPNGTLSGEDGQTIDSVITLVTGAREAVKGPPSEVNSRLRRGT